MKKYTTIILLAILAVVAIAIYFLNPTRPTNTVENEAQNPPVVTENSTSTESIKGCYVAKLDKDVYTLTLISENGKFVLGTLQFKNFQKDSSSGVFDGTFVDGLLYGTYVFQSEGSTSTIDVIFKKTENGFVRGFGDMTANGEHFVTIDNLKYDVTPEFTKTTENCNVN